MFTDSFFTQGSTHKICEDYALHGSNYVVISDGCSSAEDSDFGSRLLARATVQAINRNDFGSNEFYYWVLATAVGYCRSLSLPPDCLFATLLAAKKIEDKIVVIMKGDGLVAAKQKNGGIYVSYLEFPFSAPFFLRYHLDETSLKDYKKQIGDTYLKYQYYITPDGQVIDFTAIKCQMGNNPYLEQWSFGEETEVVTVMSDGILSFVKPEITATQKRMVKIEESEIIPKLMAFKDFNGEFVQRRCNMAFKLFEKDGWKSLDDVSVGAIS